MKKIILIIILLTATTAYSQYYHKDTVEAGSSDSIYAPSIEGEPNFINVTFIQLDTNGVSSPDSVAVEQVGYSGYVARLGFRKSATDSVLDVVKLTYVSGGLPHFSTIVSGWIWQPYIPGLRFRLVNAVYRAGRRILVSVEFQ